MNAKPFAFETEFDPAGSVVEEGRVHRRYTQDQVDEMVAAARQEGEQSEVARAEQQIAAAATALAQSLAPVRPKLVELSDTLRREAGELALALSKRIADHALRTYPTEQLEALLQDAAQQLPAGPKITVAVNPDLVPVLQPLISQHLPDHVIDLTGETALPPGDWSMSWAEGGMSFSQEELFETLDALVKTHLESPVDAQGDLFSDVA